MVKKDFAGLAHCSPVSLLWQVRQGCFFKCFGDMLQQRSHMPLFHCEVVHYFFCIHASQVRHNGTYWNSGAFENQGAAYHSGHLFNSFAAFPEDVRGGAEVYLDFFWHGREWWEDGGRRARGLWMGDRHDWVCAVASNGTFYIGYARLDFLPAFFSHNNDPDSAGQIALTGFCVAGYDD